MTDTGFPYTPVPTFAGFVDWVYGTMGVPSAWLPSDAQVLTWAYNYATGTVNTYFACVPGPFNLIVTYNLGGHFLACWAQDPTPFPGSPPAPYITVDGVGYGFWAWLRKANNISGFITGIVSSSSDEGTSVGLVVPKQAENLTVGQLQLTTTLWGRTYLGLAQDYGTNWGIS